MEGGGKEGDGKWEMINYVEKSSDGVDSRRKKTLIIRVEWMRWSDGWMTRRMEEQRDELWMEREPYGREETVWRGKQNYVLQDGVALIRITRAWQWKKKTDGVTVCGGMDGRMEECYRWLDLYIITGIMLGCRNGGGESENGKWGGREKHSKEVER